MGNRKPTQKDRVLAYIRSEGSITALEAVRELGILQLSARLVELEKEGYVFTKTPEKSKNRFDETVHYIRYGLAEG
jgi:predicted ArsR family transcriptional regulator